MQKILKENLGVTSQAKPIKKTTEPCKYEVLDPNISDEE